MNAVAEKQQHTETELNRGSESDILFWALLAIYAFARVLQIYPGGVPMLGVVALHVFPPAIFAVIHGVRGYRLSGILTFVGITLIVGNVFENLGIRTGFIRMACSETCAASGCSLDEMWSWIFCKEKNRTEEIARKNPDAGDIWLWTCVDADSKLVPTWRLGQRDVATATESGAI